jgi:hypothetical protein
MPVSIITSLMLWTSLLAPAGRHEPDFAVNVDRTVSRAVDDHLTNVLCSWPVQAVGCWASLDADTEVEETGDGDPESLATEAFWLSPHDFSEGSVSPIRRSQAIAGQCARSPILRC